METTSRTRCAVGLNVPEFALHWCRKLGLPSASLTQLRGGINNLVYRCGSDESCYVIKGYAPAILGETDRMRAEVEFLQYAQLVAAQFVPALLHVDVSQRCVVLEYVEGVLYQDGTSPSDEDVRLACVFFERLNEDLSTAQSHVHQNAAEAYLRLTDHLQNVQHRFSKMTTEHLLGDEKELASRLLSKLTNRIDLVYSETLDAITPGEVMDAINPDQFVLSPSDFGFHNAIRTSDGIKFFDFEFSGWDDPAKVLADFLLQPRVQVDSGYISLIQTLFPDQGSHTYTRYKILRRILRLKWACIILSVLNPTRLHRITQVSADGVNKDFLLMRLRNAEKYLEMEDGEFALH